MITKDFILSAPCYSTSKEDEVRINCPECDDTKGHMYCNIEKMVYVCHRCGAKGKIVEEFKADVENYKKVILTNVPINPIKTIRQEIRQVKNLPFCSDANVDPVAYNYLLKRGLTHGEINRHDIKVSNERHGVYHNTIIFPIYNSGNYNLKYFVARKYDGTNPKYVNAPWPKGNALFEANHNADIQSYMYQPSVLCEGIFDALAIARIGYNAIALLGKVATKEQLYRLYQNHKQLIIYLDFDAFTQAIQLKLQLMALGIRSEIIKQTDDAADLYLKDKKQLEVELNEASSRLTKLTK